MNSQLHIASQPPQLSLSNGSFDTTRSNNVAATVARGGTINHNNPNSNCDEKHQHRSNFLSQDVHSNDDNRMDLHNNRNGTSPPSTTARPIDVRYHHFHPPSRPSSSSLNSSASLAVSSHLSIHADTSQNMLALDNFLNAYEKKYGLEPLESDQVQGLSNMSSLPLSLKITGTSRKNNSYTIIPQNLQEDLPKKPIASSTCSLDISQQPAAPASYQDDIQDKNPPDNNNADSKGAF